MKNVKNKKAPGGMRGNKLKLEARNKHVFMFAFGLFAFLVCGAITGDFFVGAGLASLAAFVPVAFKEDPTKTAEENAIAKIQNEIANALGKADDLTKAEINALKESLDALVKNDVIVKSKDVMAELIKMAGEIAALKEVGNGGASKLSFKAQIVDFIVKNKDEIKSMLKKGTGTIEIELKAVADITTGSAINVGTVPTQYGETTDPQIVGNWIEGYTTTSNTNSPNYPYTEVLPKDGNYAFLAEAATKPQIDFKMETRFATPVKAAAWEKLTEEAMDDIPRMNDLANQILLKKHNIFKQRGIISGDGISPNPKGILEYGRAFVPGDMAGKVQAPNFMDVINAAIADMRTTHNYQDEIPYIANVVMLNDIDFFLEVQSAKDTTGRPLFNYNPITQVATMGSVAVIPTPEIEAGNILVADVTKYNVVNYKPYTVRIGWVNDDFIKNQFVILGESRFYGFVKKLDEQAFIYDSIDTIKDALRLV
jgi:hypothetical protein